MAVFCVGHILKNSPSFYALFAVIFKWLHNIEFLSVQALPLDFSVCFMSHALETPFFNMCLYVAFFFSFNPCQLATGEGYTTSTATLFLL